MLSTSNKTSSASWIKDLFGLALMLGLFYAIWIGSHALFTPDEGRYSEVAREMVVTGDFITPRVNGVPFLDKPILYYWLQASAIYLFGVKEWAIRLWPAIFGVLGCLLMYFTGRYAFSRRTGILSALILATSPIYYGGSHYANLDLEVAIFISASLCFSILALQSTDHVRSQFFILAYISCALAALTKGLIGIVFPMMIIGAWIALLNRWSIIPKMRLITGLIIFAAITIPWYVLAQRANPQFFQYFFVNQQVSRFLSEGDYNNKTVFWFYIPIVFAGVFPWSLFAIQAIGTYLKDVWKNKNQHATELFLLLWFFIVFIFFSIPLSKTIGYILPVFPVLALMIGHYFDRIWEKKSIGFYVGSLAFILMSVAIAIGSLLAKKISAIEIPSQVLPHLMFTAIVFSIAAIVTTVFLMKNAKPVRAIFSWFLLITVIGLLTLSASAQYLNQKSMKPMAMTLQKIAKPDDEIATYLKFFQDLPIYTGKRITVVANWNDPHIPYNDNWQRELWYGMAFQDTSDWLINEDVFWKRWNSQKRLFVLMKNHDYPAFAAASKRKVYMIQKCDDIFMVSNRN